MFEHQLMRLTIADGLRANGAAGVVISLFATALFGLHRRGRRETVTQQ